MLSHWDIFEFQATNSPTPAGGDECEFLLWIGAESRLADQAWQVMKKPAWSAFGRQTDGQVQANRRLKHLQQQLGC